MNDLSNARLRGTLDAALFMLLCAALGLLLGVLAVGCDRSATRETLAWAQRGLAGLQVSTHADAAMDARVTPQYIYVDPVGSASLTVDVPVLGRLYAIDTARHPGPWCLELVIQRDVARPWAQVQGRPPAECLAGTVAVSAPTDAGVPDAGAPTFDLAHARPAPDGWKVRLQETR